MMAYYQQKILSGTAGGTGSSVITVVGGAIDDSYINKAVTFDGVPADLANPKVKLAADGQMVVASIIGFSYGRLQLAADGWDIKFINGTATAIAQNVPILGAEHDSKLGFIKGYAAPGTWNAAAGNTLAIARGMVVDGGPASKAGEGIVRVAMRYGAR